MFRALPGLPEVAPGSDLAALVWDAARATRSSSIFLNSLRSMLSKRDTMVQGAKVLLVDRLQHLAHGVLDQLVLERRDPNRPRLALFLRDEEPPDRLMATTLRHRACSWRFASSACPRGSVPLRLTARSAVRCLLRGAR
jgi:hypothetical protein